MIYQKTYAYLLRGAYFDDKKAWKIITPLLSAVIGVCLANKFNIFDFLPFVPNEYTYEICITAYFAVIDIIIDFFMEFFLTL